MIEGKTYNFYNGAQNVEHIDTQINHYHYYGEQQQEMTEEENKVVEELLPIFFGDEKVVKDFLVKIRGAKAVQVVAEVNALLKDRKVSDVSCNKPLWDILKRNGYYDKGLNNWNDQIKK